MSILIVPAAAAAAALEALFHTSERSFHFLLQNKFYQLRLYQCY